MNKKLYKETFEQITMPEESIEKVKQLECAPKKKHWMFNRALRYAAVFVLAFMIADAAVYAASGNGIIQRVTAVINGKSYQVDLEKKTDEHGDGYYVGHIAESKTESEKENVDSSDEADSSAKQLFAINEITGQMSSAMKYYDPELHYAKMWDNARIKEYLGVDIIDAINVMPSGYEMKYTGGETFAVTYENAGTLVEDRVCYEFEGRDYKKVMVLASKLRTPYDCLYQLDSEKKTSFRLQSGDILQVLVAAQFKPDNANEYAFYVADFEYEGVYYRIEMENIESRYLDRFIRKLLEP